MQCSIFLWAIDCLSVEQEAGLLEDEWSEWDGDHKQIKQIEGAATERTLMQNEPIGDHFEHDLDREQHREEDVKIVQNLQITHSTAPASVHLVWLLPGLIWHSNFFYHYKAASLRNFLCKTCFILLAL